RPGRVRPHLEQVELLAPAARGIRDREGVGVCPDALPLRLDLLRVVPFHETKKPPFRRPWEKAATARRALPALPEKLLHSLESYQRARALPRHGDRRAR